MSNDLLAAATAWLAAHPKEAGGLIAIIALAFFYLNRSEWG
jgi:hypothetical protein